MASREEQWKALWKAEKATCTEYTGHRAIMDWSGYGDAQEKRRKAAWHWLDDRIAEIQAGKHHDDDPNQDQMRVNYMQAVLDGYDHYWWNVPDYPRDHATDDESCKIKERSYYCSFFGEGKKKDGQDAPYDDQQDRKQENVNWLKERHQWLEDCAAGKIDGQPKGWDKKNRRQRYENVRIALHWGDVWDQWAAGDYVPEGEKGSWRDASADWHEKHLGITENPANSNCDSRSDGIRTSQDGCANGTWLRNQPWCGCWAWSGLYAAGKVNKGESWLASVASIEDYAKAGKGPFKGWTTDGSKAKKGDLVILFGRGQHVGTVRSIDSNYAYTWEGNTSSGSSGSQSNGGGSYKRSRSRSSETYGYALVKD